MQDDEVPFGYRSLEFDTLDRPTPPHVRPGALATNMTDMTDATASVTAG
jgi:hypothetical protein